MALSSGLKFVLMALGGGVALYLLKKPAGALGVTPGAQVRLELTSAGASPPEQVPGRRVGAITPVTVNEGGLVNALVYVTNTSVKGLSPWSASLIVRVRAAVGASAPFVTLEAGQTFFNANQELAFGYQIAVPLGIGSVTVTVTADVLRPDGTAISGALATATFTVTEIPLSYGASIRYRQP